MIVVDKTGRKLKPGEQVVDVCFMGMIQGVLLKIVDSPISIPGSNPIPPHLVIQVTTTPLILPNGMCPDVYIIGDLKTKEQEAESFREKLKITGGTTH